MSAHGSIKPAEFARTGMKITGTVAVAKYLLRVDIVE